MDLRERTKLIQKLNDRLLYLDADKLKDFLIYLDTLYEVYPCPRTVLYGEEIAETHGKNTSV